MVHVLNDLPYTSNPPTVAAGRNTLDVYLPDVETFPNPAVLYLVHGGGWKIGNKADFAPMAQAFAEEGVLCVLPNYRLTKHPDHIQDVASSLAWTMQHMSAYPLTPNRGKLFIGGHSAGGHLTALVATDPQYLAAEGRDIGAVAGVISVAAFLNFGDGSLFPTFPVAQCSPTQLVRPGLPPWLVLNADNDLGTLRDQGEAHTLALIGAGVSTQRYVISPRDHTTIMYKMAESGDEGAARIFAWITEKSQ